MHFSCPAAAKVGGWLGLAVGASVFSICKVFLFMFFLACIGMRKMFGVTKRRDKN